MKTENVMLALGGAALLVYFVSKQKTNGDDGFQFPTIPNISIPSSIQIPGGLGAGLSGLGFQASPGLTMPDLSNFDLGLSDINWPDFSGLNLPTIPGLPDLGLPGLPDLGLPELPGVNGDRKTWNPLWFLPDLRFELPSISFPGLPSLPSLDLPEPGNLPRWLDVLTDISLIPFMWHQPLSGAIKRTWELGYQWVSTELETPAPGARLSEGQTGSELATPFFVPQPVGAAPGTEPASVQGTPTEYPKQLPSGGLGGGPEDLYIL